MVPWRHEPIAVPNIGSRRERQETDSAESEEIYIEEPVAQELGAVQQRLRASTRSLSSEAPSQLVKGVPLRICLSGWGKAFANNQPDSEKSYTLSQVTSSIDAFLSHDWKTARPSKACALLLIFNALPAAVTSLTITLLTSGLLAVGLLPGGWPIASAGTFCSFYVVLCFWQRIRRALRRVEVLVFLDRLCIAQHDDRLKRQGILSLGGILAKSAKLIVLWSPRYFSRTWCSFELASFLRDEAKVGCIEFIPVAMALLLCATHCIATICFFSWQAWVYLGNKGSFESVGDWNEFETPILVGMLFMVPVTMSVWPVQTYFGILHMQDLVKLQQQMSTFSVRASQCTCCSLGHVDPTSGEEIICDRQLVFRTLKKWFQRSQEEEEEYLNRFDALVRERLSVHVLRGLASGTPAFRYIFAMVVSTSFPVLPQYVYLAARDGGAKWPFVLDYFKLPAVVLCFFWLGLFTWRSGAALSAWVPRCIAVLLVQCAALVMLMGFWLPYELMVNRFFRPWAILVSLAYMWVIVVGLYMALYFPAACRWRR